MESVNLRQADTAKTSDGLIGEAVFREQKDKKDNPCVPVFPVVKKKVLTTGNRECIKGI